MNHLGRLDKYLGLKGMVRVEYEGGSLDVHTGQAMVTAPGEWVRYSTPGPDGAEYVAVCLPAFSPATVHRTRDAPHYRADGFSSRRFLLRSSAVNVPMERARFSCFSSFSLAGVMLSRVGVGLSL